MCIRDSTITVSGIFLLFNVLHIQSIIIINPVSYTHLDVYKRQAVAAAAAGAPPAGSSGVGAAAGVWLLVIVKSSITVL